MSLLFRFYVDESEEGKEKVKWKSSTIHHLHLLYQKLQLNKVIDNEFDVHNTPIEELSVPQLRHECEKRRLDDKGLKVTYVLYFSQ